VKPPSPPDRHDALKELLGKLGRDFVPVRKSFTQRRNDAGEPIPGPLATIVRRGVASALDQYLLLHARAVGRPTDGSEELDYDVRFSSRVWARLLGLAEDESGRRAVGRNWSALADAKLIKATRKGRNLTITLLREDGTGNPYTRPTTAADPFLKIPHSFWLDGHAAKLRLPGLAMAVIARSLVDWFPLPFDKGPAWYGIGASTVERGLRELRRADLLDSRFAWRKTSLSDTGWTKDTRYALKPPLGPIGRVSRSAPPELLPAESADESLTPDG